MRVKLLSCMFVIKTIFVRAAIVEFDLSPPGSNPGVGLSPLNEVIPGLSAGSGNEINGGILYDAPTRRLTLNVGYGSATGFADLTGPAFSWFLHGPAGIGQTAPVLFDLAPLHTFAADPSEGGRIVGTLFFSAADEANLLGGFDYINIYTPANPGGEIRGQLLVVPEPSPAALLLGAGALALIWQVAERRRRIGRRCRPPEA